MPDRGAKFRPPEGGCKCDPDCPCHQLQPLTREQIEEIEETFEEEDCDEEKAVALVKSLEEAIDAVKKATNEVKQYGKKLQEQDPTDSVWEEVHATYCNCEFCREIEERRLERERNRTK